MLASLPFSRCSTPALQPGSPHRPARPGTRLPGCRARRLPPSPAAGAERALWPPALHRADASLWSRAELQERNPRLSVIRALPLGASWSAHKPHLVLHV